MRQSIIHVQTRNYENLALEIQKQIDEYYEDMYYLADIQYFGMEDQDCDCHAFLLFHEFTED